MRYLLIIICILILGCENKDNPLNDAIPELNTRFYKGMDLSFQTELESYDIDYKDEQGNSVDFIDYVESRGINMVRLKLWHTSQDGENTLTDVKAYAQRIKAKNMHFLLNFHYSDYWADPGTQTPPAEWQDYSFDQVKVAIYIYTRNVVQALKNQNTLPKIIQIGNETDSGFLWDYGKVWNEFDENWPNYAELVNEAIRAINDVDTENKIKIMLHHSSVENAIYFFNELEIYNLDFDIIGLSYYPQFQTKNLSLVQQKLNDMRNALAAELKTVVFK